MQHETSSNGSCFQVICVLLRLALVLWSLTWIGAILLPSAGEMAFRRLSFLGLLAFNLAVTIRELRGMTSRHFNAMAILSNSLLVVLGIKSAFSVEKTVDTVGVQVQEGVWLLGCGGFLVAALIPVLCLVVLVFHRASVNAGSEQPHPP